ncbi:MAG: SDR family oxidoreductase [Hyphomicrobiales bacterium]|nr:SDR family oxidoreductase [Hyphomicrobiales bacterium]
MNNSGTLPECAENILIIGAYGLIGYGIVKRLLADGHQVTGLGRSGGTAKRVLPDIPWIIKDMSTLCEADSWNPILRQVSVVVNCSGALQEGPDDDLEAVHNHCVSALASACSAADVRLINISAVGACLDASTAFLSSKARGDAAIRSSGAQYNIFRPGLVLASSAYGGTAMLRMLAAVPLVQPIAMPQALIQAVSLDDLANVVSAAIDGRIPDGYEADLVEAEPHPLREVVAMVRNWLGFGTARREFVIPAIGAMAVCKLADALSLLGWRSPLRTTAFKVLSEGVKGKPADLTPFGIAPFSTMSQTLANMPARAEDRLFARMALLTPIMIVILSLFWLASGVIGLAQINEAAITLERVGWPRTLAVAGVAFWALVDIAIAGAFALRRFAHFACWAAIGVSIFYLVASTLFVPWLWIDPLGPLIKVIPGIILALVTRVALEPR